MSSDYNVHCETAVITLYLIIMNYALKSANTLRGEVEFQLEKIDASDKNMTNYKYNIYKQFFLTKKVHCIYRYSEPIWVQNISFLLYN